LNQIWTFMGWLDFWHRSSLPAIAFTVISTFSFFDIFPTGLTKSGKVNGTFKKNSSLLYSIFWYQLNLTDNLEPPSICYKHKKHMNKITKPFGPRNHNLQNTQNIISTWGICNVNKLGPIKPPSWHWIIFSLPFLSFISTSRVE